VAANRHGARALLGALAGDRLQALEISCGERERNAGRGELPRELRADAIGAARDENHLAHEGTLHAAPSLRWTRSSNLATFTTTRSCVPSPTSSFSSRAS